MLTRIEVSGFRNLVDFTVDLGAFQILAGPNASGKSNFFDLLVFLSRLASNDSIRSAFAGIRGEPLEQFTTSKPGSFLKTMKIAVEAIVPRNIRDPWGEGAELSSTHLRYSVELRVVDSSATGPSIRIAREELRSLRKSQTKERLGFPYSTSFAHSYLRWRSSRPAFISTESDRIVLHQDGRAGRKREYRKDDLQGTVLSAVNAVTFRHAYAMRQVLCGIKVLQLEPSNLRMPSEIGVFSNDRDAVLGTTGSNLPTVLARMQSLDSRTLAELAASLRSVVSDAVKVDVLKDETHKQWIARVSFSHGGPFPATLLSDGTLRILALAAMRHDPRHEGVLCFEEPENGIHPLRMKGFLTILRGLAVDPGAALPPGRSALTALRQLLVNTHSPVLVSLAPSSALLFAECSRHARPDLDDPVLVGRFLKVKDELALRQAGKRRDYVTRREVLDYLQSVEQTPWQSASNTSAE